MRILLYLVLGAAGMAATSGYFGTQFPSDERLAGFDSSGTGANVIDMPFSVMVGVPWNVGQWTKLFEVPDSGTTYRPSVSQLRVVGKYSASSINNPFLRVVNEDGYVIWEQELSLEAARMDDAPRMFSGDVLQVQHFGGQGGTNIFTIEGVLHTDAPPQRN